MLSITINDFIKIKMCSTTLCVSMSTTAEQFVEVRSSNGASDAARCIYTYPLNVLAQDCQKVFVPVQSTWICTLMYIDTTVSHKEGQILPFSVLIKTLKLLAPSSTNPIALCSLLVEPNGLTQSSSHSFSPSLFWLSFSLCECEHLWLFVMNGQGKRGEGWMWDIAPLRPVRIEGEKTEWTRQAETKKKRIWVYMGVWFCVNTSVWMLGGEGRGRGR